MILYEMITLRIPYDDVELFNVKGELLRNRLPSLKGIDPQYQFAEDLVRWCLEIQPSKRPSADALLLRIMKLEAGQASQ